MGLAAHLPDVIHLLVIALEATQVGGGIGGVVDGEFPQFHGADGIADGDQRITHTDTGHGAVALPAVPADISHPIVQADGEIDVSPVHILKAVDIQNGTFVGPDRPVEIAHIKIPEVQKNPTVIPAGRQFNGGDRGIVPQNAQMLCPHAVVPHHLSQSSKRQQIRVGHHILRRNPPQLRPGLLQLLYGGAGKEPMIQLRQKLRIVIDGSGAVQPAGHLGRWADDKGAAVGTQAPKGHLPGEAELDVAVKIVELAVDLHQEQGTPCGEVHGYVPLSVLDRVNRLSDAESSNDSVPSAIGEGNPSGHGGFAGHNKAYKTVEDGFVGVPAVTEENLPRVYSQYLHRFFHILHSNQLGRIYPAGVILPDGPLQQRPADRWAQGSRLPPGCLFFIERPVFREAPAVVVIGEAEIDVALGGKGQLSQIQVGLHRLIRLGHHLAVHHNLVQQPPVLIQGLISRPTVAPDMHGQIV